MEGKIESCVTLGPAQKLIGIFTFHFQVLFEPTQKF